MAIRAPDGANKMAIRAPDGANKDMLLLLFVVEHPGLHLFPVGIPVPVEGKSYEPPKIMLFSKFIGR